MEKTLPEILTAFGRIAHSVNEVLRHADDAQARSRRVTELLRSCTLPSPLYICLLEGNDQSSLCALDESGQVRSEWEAPLRVVLSQGGTTERRPAATVKIPQAMKLPGYSLVLEEIAFRARSWGFLGLAVPKTVSAELLAGTRALLAVCGEQLAASLHAEALEHQVQSLQRELEGQSSLANTGELAGPLTHEFNNFLNIVLLHIALLEAEVPERIRADLLEVRRQGAGTTSLVKQFQQYRRRLQVVQEQVDINGIVREVVQTLAGPQSESELLVKLPPSSRIESSSLARPAAVPLRLALAPKLPAVLGSAADLKRLCTFLVMNAAAAAGPIGGHVTVRTESSDRNVLLRVEDTGPSVSPEMLLQLFEPASAGRPGTNSLELAACETLVRRLQGKIRGENGAEGGVAIIVELPRGARASV